MADPTQQATTASLDLHGLCQHGTELAAACNTLDHVLAARKALYEAGTRNPDQLPYAELGMVYQKAYLFTVPQWAMAGR
ncbi:MAG: hypothetical protein WBD20_17140, partial [Pirellulaceae bacterium]